jgi:hypothetical protein
MIYWNEEIQGRYRVYHAPTSDRDIVQLNVIADAFGEVIAIGTFYSGVENPDVQHFQHRRMAAFTPAIPDKEMVSYGLRLRRKHMEQLSALGLQHPELAESLDACVLELASCIAADVSAFQDLSMSSFYQ